MDLPKDHLGHSAQPRWLKERRANALERVASWRGQQTEEWEVHRTDSLGLTRTVIQVLTTTADTFTHNLTIVLSQIIKI